jgi:S-(hydroxymethyl)glutathione dehydrogenase / alcohol dehydrogenase
MSLDNALPRTSRAAILVAQNAPLEISEIELPDVLDVGQVLVKVHVSGICGSQLGEIDGAKGPDKFLPHLLGHEGAATVLACGPGVKKVKPSDDVVLHWRKGPGIECTPPKYRWQGQTVNAGWVTSFNEFAVVSENRVTTLPTGSDREVAALFGCAVTTGFGVAENNAKLKLGEAVVVFGAGGVGLNIVQAAALKGAWPVIAVDVHDNRLALAAEMGATHRINAKSTDAEAAIREVLLACGQKQGLDVFIDNTGQPSIIEMGYRVTHGTGRVILVGVPRAGKDVTLHSLPLHFGKLLTGSHGGEAQPELDIPRYHNLFAAGRIKLHPLLTNRYPLERVNDAITDMRSGAAAGRCLLHFG